MTFHAHLSSRVCSVSLTALVALSLLGLPLHAQQPALNAATTVTMTTTSTAGLAALPSAPMPQNTGQTHTEDEHTDGQSKRVLGIIPNFRAVDADQHLPPQTIRDKFTDATEDSFDYSSIFVPLAVAGYNDLRNATPEFGSGGIGYARYLWHSAVDQTSENYLVEFIVPVITHEDTRYYSLESGGFAKRASYALTRVVITRSDSGRETFNIGEVVGSGMAAGISTLYYPSRERSFSNVGSQWGTSVAIDAVSFLVKEYSPEIDHAFLHHHKIFHIPGTGTKD